MLVRSINLPNNTVVSYSADSIAQCIQTCKEICKTKLALSFGTSTLISQGPTQNTSGMPSMNTNPFIMSSRSSTFSSLSSSSLSTDQCSITSHATDHTGNQVSILSSGCESATSTVKSNIQISLDTTDPSMIMTSRFETSFLTYFTLSVSALSS